MTASPAPAPAASASRRTRRTYKSDFDRLTPDAIAYALKFIPADLDRDTWANMAMAVKSELGEEGFSIWDTWSRSSEKYNARAAKDTWKSTSAYGGITLGTLIHLAKEHGYNPSNHAAPQITEAEAAERRKKREAEAEAERKKTERNQEEAAKKAQRIFDNASRHGATEHPYIRRKQIQPPEGVRIGTYPRFCNGEEVDIADALLIPIRNADKDVISLQAIFPDENNPLERDRDYLPNGRKRGGFFMVGAIPKDAAAIIVCEGFATGCSLHQATGYSVLVAFDAGNLATVAQIAREKRPAARIILAADDDKWKRNNTGVKNSTEAANLVGGIVALPSFRDESSEPTDFNDLACLEGLPEVAAQIERAIHQATTTPAPANDNSQAAHGETEEQQAPADKEQRNPLEPINPHELSEDALALIFEAYHREELRYCHTAGAWFAWTGTRWKHEKTGLAFHWAREVCRHYSEGQPRFSKAATAAAVERFAQSARCFAVTGETWDRDPWLMGTPGGTLDLRTGTVREAMPGDHITRQAGPAPAEPGTVPKKWLAFLHDATRGDTDLIRFLQQMAGYALTGDTSEHALFFIYGAGGNGKSVFLNTLSGVLAEYAMTAPMDTFTASNQDKHPTGIAMLKGARLVSASETEDGRAWAEEKIKNMTGGDPLTARFMRRDFFTFTPEFKLIIVGNHKPRLNNVDDATKRRFNIIPFIHKPTNPDPDLEKALRAELPAIFRWMIDGCLDWQAHGLVRPAVVEQATREYFEDQDVFGQWLSDQCEVHPQYRETSAALFSSWKRYAEAAGEHAGSAKAFGEAMRKRGFSQYRTVSARGFSGLRVTPKQAQFDPRDPSAWSH